MNSWTSTIVAACAIAAILLLIGGCPYDLSGPWEGTCEVEGEALVVGNEENVWVPVSWEFNLDLAVTEQQSHLWGEGDGTFVLRAGDVPPYPGELTFDVTGERMNSWAEITLEGDGDSDGVNLELAGRIYQDAVAGDCQVELERMVTDLDNGEFLLER